MVTDTTPATTSAVATQPNAAGADIAIDVHNVSKTFSQVPVLRNISVSIASGSLTALLGPSGGGKSTLLRVIAGLETPDTGTVTIAGADATRLPPQRRNVGFVFQHYAAFKHLTVAGNVAFGLEIRRRPKSEIRQRVAELLELVHLEPLANRYPAQLSGGQRQRMALARALAVEPQVLLLDEPFGALDAQVRKELRTWLRRLHDDVHVTTVFVTHDQEEAMDIADHLVVLADGRVQQTGRPADLYDNPSNPFVMGFLGPVTHLNGTKVRPHDIKVLPADTPEATPATVTRVTRLGFEVRIELKTTGHEELWVQLTRTEADTLNLAEGDLVAVSANPHARTPTPQPRPIVPGLTQTSSPHNRPASTPPPAPGPGLSR